MAMAEAALASTPYGSTRGNSLADVVDLILDKGLVIDAFVRVSVIGIEVLTIDARIVIASVDTYLRFAEGREPPRPHPDQGGHDVPGPRRGIREREDQKGV
jgi:gas vesicle structural protein